MDDPTIMRSFSNDQLSKFDQEEQARRAAQEKQNSPVITNLAGYVRSCWDPALQAKLPIETRMLKAMRQRRGQYEPEKLAAI